MTLFRVSYFVSPPLLKEHLTSRISSLWEEEKNVVRTSLLSMIDDSRDDDDIGSPYAWLQQIHFCQSSTVMVFLQWSERTRKINGALCCYSLSSPLTSSI